MNPAAAAQPRKRLLFDRRYGWIFDDWKDPAEEALAGGRGMFCILPIAKALVKIASHSINSATGSVVKTLENQTLLAPNSLKASPSNWSQKVMHSAQRVDLKLLIQQRDQPLDCEWSSLKDDSDIYSTSDNYRNYSCNLHQSSEN